MMLGVHATALVGSLSALRNLILVGLILDGGYGEDCRSEYDSDFAHNINCAVPCSAGCVVLSSTSGSETRYYCRCDGNTGEPTCCHLYTLYNGADYVGAYAEGQCGPDGCNGNSSQSCAKVLVPTPPGQGAKYKAICK